MNFQPRLPLPEPPQPLEILLYPHQHRELARLLRTEPSNKRAAAMAKLHEMLWANIARRLADGTARIAGD